jgi:hypothetical protein
MDRDLESVAHGPGRRSRDGRAKKSVFAGMGEGTIHIISGAPKERKMVI